MRLLLFGQILGTKREVGPELIGVKAVTTECTLGILLEVQKAEWRQGEGELPEGSWEGERVGGGVGSQEDGWGEGR